MNQVEIVKANKYHLNELSLLFKELSGRDSNLIEMEKQFNIIIDNNNYVHLCAIYNNKVIGTVMGIICHDLVGECKPFMVLENVIVSLDFRNNGVGKLLLHEIENIAHNINCHYIIFVSDMDRINAHKFYESIGYDLNVVQGFKKFLL